MARHNEVRLFATWLCKRNDFGVGFKRVSLLNVGRLKCYSTLVDNAKQVGFENKNILGLKERNLLVGIFPDKV